MKRVWSKSPYSITLETSSQKEQALFAKVVLQAAHKTLNALPLKELRLLEKKRTYTLGISFLSKSEMHKINKHYRKKDRPTDVLSFSRLEGIRFPTPHPEVGDILICLPVAKSQAMEYETSLKCELQRLTIHGVLHLFGYDHEKNRKEEIRMFRLQDKILESL